jgi:hypothetical protein
VLGSAIRALTGVIYLKNKVLSHRPRGTQACFPVYP